MSVSSISIHGGQVSHLTHLGVSSSHVNKSVFNLKNGWLKQAPYSGERFGSRLPGSHGKIKGEEEGDARKEVGEEREVMEKRYTVLYYFQLKVTIKNRPINSASAFPILLLNCSGSKGVRELERLKLSSGYVIWHLRFHRKVWMVTRPASESRTEKGCSAVEISSSFCATSK